MNINDFTPITPESLRKNTEEELLFIKGYGKTHSGWGEWAGAELQRRQMVFLQEIMLSLTNSTNNVNDNVILLAKISVGVGNVTDKLLSTTKDVHTEIATLSSSSDRLEGLTVKLKNLTWALIWLTAAMILVSVGIEVWHVHREIDAPLPPIVIQHLLPTSPQTPHLPVR